MILKEAFRNQNYLTTLIDMGLSYLGNKNNIVEVKEEHMRTKTNKDAIDETIIAVKPTVFENKDITVNNVIDFVMDVVGEKQKITDAIAKAKKWAELDIDSAIALNKTKQNIAFIFSSMSNIKGDETIRKRADYKFNTDGVQVNYYYDMKEITTIDFDRNKVKALYKKLTKETDETSAKLDLVNITTDVEYEPKYEIGDSLEDCINKFLG